MAKSTFKVSALAMLVMATVLVCSEHVTARNCNPKANIGDLVSKCEQFVVKTGPPVKPSGDCCGVVKKADVPCLCSLLTKNIEDYISMEKVIYVAKSCGNKIPRGTKCGSYTAPAA